MKVGDIVHCYPNERWDPSYSFLECIGEIIGIEHSRDGTTVAVGCVATGPANYDTVGFIASWPIECVHPIRTSAWKDDHRIIRDSAGNEISVGCLVAARNGGYSFDPCVGVVVLRRDDGVVKVRVLYSFSSGSDDFNAAPRRAVGWAYLGRELTVIAQSDGG